MTQNDNSTRQQGDDAPDSHTLTNRAGHGPDIEPELRIDVVSDVVCPWCYVGKRRLEQAMELLPGVRTEVFWRPFQLDGTIPKGGIPRAEYLARKFGSDKARDMYARLEGVGRNVGINFAFERIKVSPNTLDAHRLIRWAQMAGGQADVTERLFDLFFTQGADIGDPDVLADLATEFGLEREVAERLLAGDSDLAEVQAEIETAQRIGVQGVPFFIFNSTIAVSGAQPAEVLAQAAHRALTQEAGDSDEAPA